jgi:hypothetical protein
MAFAERALQALQRPELERVSQRRGFLGGQADQRTAGLRGVDRLPTGARFILQTGQPLLVETLDPQRTDGRTAKAGLKRGLGSIQGTILEHQGNDPRALH